MQKIDRHLQERVDQETHRYIDLAAGIFGKEFPPVEISHDLTGSASGVFMVNGSKVIIRYNPYIFSKHFDYCLGNTVPHEAAHYVMYLLYGIKGVRPHGKEWKSLMRKFGVEPNRTNTLDLSGIPIKRQQRHMYRCDCQSHEVTTTRHNRMAMQRARYYCRVCKGELKQQDATSGQ